MKQIFALLAFLGLPVVVVAFENEPDGFRNIKWGTHISANSSEMTVLERSKNDAYCYRKGDKLTIGGATLKRITYNYWKSQFMSVLIDSVGIENKSALIAAFQAQFGKPERPNQFLDDYWWNGAVTSIRIKCEPIGTKCSAFIYSTELLGLQREEDKKTAAGAGKDF